MNTRSDEIITATAAQCCYLDAQILYLASGMWTARVIKNTPEVDWQQ
jgi:hypothetical protein